MKLLLGNVANSKYWQLKYKLNERKHKTNIEIIYGLGLHLRFSQN